MSAASNPQATNQPTTTATLNSDVASALNTADTTASKRLQALGLVHQARVAQLTRTAASLTTEYGASSAQAKAAEAAISASKITVARIAVINRQVSVTQPPQVAASGWAIYGHVYNSQLAPAVAYTIFFVNEQNTYQREIGFAYTGKDGSFHLNYPGLASAPAPDQLYLEIVNAKAQPVYLAATAFQPQVGVATYQDITLPAGEPVLGDPPAEIRETAFPETKRP
jgi:hypothetical protein